MYKRESQTLEKNLTLPWKSKLVSYHPTATSPSRALIVCGVVFFICEDCTGHPTFIRLTIAVVAINCQCEREGEKLARHTPVATSVNGWVITAGISLSQLLVRTTITVVQALLGCCADANLPVFLVLILYK